MPDTTTAPRPVPTPADLAAIARPPRPPAAPPAVRTGYGWPRGEYDRGIRGSGLPANARLVALTLAGLADRSGRINQDRAPSMGRLAQITGLSQRYAAPCVRVLETTGWLIRHPLPAGVPEHSPRGITLTLPPGHQPGPRPH